MDVNESDLARIINERDQLREQVKRLQERGTELVTANRELKAGRKVSGCCGAPIVQDERADIPNFPMCSKCELPAGV